MLDQLVESKNNSPENRRKGTLFLGLLALAVITILSATTYSLFAKDYGMGGGDLELTSLVAPPPPADEPPPPKEEKKPEENQKKAPDVDVRKELIQNIDSTPVKPPDKIESARKDFQAMRKDVKPIQGDRDITNNAASVDRNNGAVAGRAPSGFTPGGGGGNDDDGTGGGGVPAGTPPPTSKKPDPTPKPAPKTVSGGVLNGKAVSLPQPPYPAAAKAVRASGKVSVQVLIDEQGRVVSASAAGGHPLLVGAAVAAARQARFSPTMLSGQPVKVSGVITYNFIP